MNAPIRYFGGKGTMLKPLLAHFPPVQSYKTYVEPYAGSGVVLLNKPRVPVEIWNDLDKNVYSLMTVLANPTLFADFRLRCELALYDEYSAQQARSTLRRDDLTPVERAFYFWLDNRTHHNGMGGAGFSINPTVRRRMSKSTSDFLATIEGLPLLHARLSSVIILNRDALDLIAQSDYPRTLLYLDPPYVQSTRTSARYAVDTDDAHHGALVRLLNQIRHAYVVLSGYDNALYDDLVGFTRHTFTVHTVSGNGTPKTKTECVWTNFEIDRQRRLFED